MSKVEYFEGVKFVNGYACDSTGKPITVSNGYSSEDEKDAQELYEICKQRDEEKKAKQAKPTQKQKKTYPEGVEFIKGRKFYKGYACAPSGEAITMENGYEPEAQREAKEAYEYFKRIEKKELEEKAAAKKAAEEQRQYEEELKRIEEEKELIKQFEEEYEEMIANQKPKEINGVKCNDAGEPIDELHGYGSEDSDWARCEEENE